MHGGFDPGELDSGNLKGLNEDHGDLAATLPTGIVQMDLAGFRKAQLVNQFRRDKRLSTGSSIDDKAKRPFAIDQNQDVGSAVSYIERS